MNDRGHLTSFPPDALVRRELRAQLPRTFFARSPERLGYLFIATGAMVASVWTAQQWLTGRCHISLYLLAVLAAVFCFPFFFFFLHELGHGVIVRGQKARLVFGWMAGFWVGLQPRLWTASHRHHHAHTNMQEDTDRLRFFGHDEPGHQHLDFRLSNPLSIPCAMFGVQTAYMFCLTSFLGGYIAYPLKRWQVVADLLAHAALAGLFVYVVGTDVWLFGYLPVFVLGSSLQNMYLITNHLTRPFADAPDALGTSQSVHIGGWSHMDFGRHVEHHLFPTVSHDKLRHVTEMLRVHHPDRFVERPLLAAVRTLFRLPGYYYSHNELTDREGRVRVRID